MSYVYNTVQSTIEMPIASAVVISVVVTGLYLLYQWALPKPLAGIPYDRDAARMLLGNVPAILAHEKVHGRMRSWFKTENTKHKAPLVQFWRSPFSKPALILSDYQEAQDILLRRTKEFDRSQRAADVFFGLVPDHHIAMTSKDHRFKGNKEVVRDLMAPAFLNDVSAPEIYSKTTTLVELWTLKAKAAKGKPFNAAKDIFDAALDIINAAAFAFDDSMSTIKHQLDHLENPEAPQATAIPSPDGSVEFTRSPDTADTVMTTILSDHLSTQFRSSYPRLNHRVRMLLSPTLRRTFSQKNEMISREVEKSLKRINSGNTDMYSALDHLLLREMSAAKKANRKPEFHSTRIYDELYGYIVGGHETSSTALAWIVKFVADNQDVQQKLRSALKSGYSSASQEGRQPTGTEISTISVPYLDAVIEESLRMATPIPVLMRTAYVDTTILGCKVPKGTAVLFITDGPGFQTPGYPIDDSLRSETSRAKHWGGQWEESNMHSFKPERWLKTDEKGSLVFDPQAGPQLVFGLGPRSCFGKRLAYLEMKVVLAMLIWNFHFKKLEEPFSSYRAYDSITTLPKFCYVALEKL